MANIEQEGETNNTEVKAEIKPENAPKRKKLTVSERMRIIDDFKHGKPDKYYSVNPNPRKPGEYILRKRKSPISYELDKPAVIEDVQTKTPSQLLTEPKKSFVGTEFFSMQSSLNANLQRELDALHEKFNKLDAKFRKERAARKSVRKQQQQEQQEDEYEYEYVDEPPQTPPVEDAPQINPLFQRRPRINIRDY